MLWTMLTGLFTVSSKVVDGTGVSGQDSMVDRSAMV
jgi:hypothetical protein